MFCCCYQRPGGGCPAPPPDTPPSKPALAAHTVSAAGDTSAEQPSCSSDDKVESAAAAAAADATAPAPVPIKCGKPGYIPATFAEDPYDQCSPIGDADLATAVADICFANAVEVCNGPGLPVPGSQPGATGEWSSDQLKGLRCLSEMVAVVQSFWDCLLPVDQSATCSKVLEFAAVDSYVRPSDQTIALCQNGTR
jgi:hypothetical protein